jgi:hypothetical protein
MPGPYLLRSSGIGLLFGLLQVSVTADAGITHGTDAEARLPYWEVRDSGVSIRLVQRLPDQTRGYFEARGFDATAVERIARGCVFQTVFRNLSPDGPAGTIDYDLREWVAVARGRKSGLKTREDWERDWVSMQVPGPAQTAFRWSLLPTRQTYRPGDYNWGMSMIELRPGTRFNLTVVWRQDGARRSALIRDIVCAADERRDPEPQ